MYICGTCVRHAQGHTCQTQGLDPVHCSECKDPAKSMLLTWTKRDGEPINVPSDEWMEAQLNHLKCQRDVLDRRIEAVETKLKRAKTE